MRTAALLAQAVLLGLEALLLAKLSGRPALFIAAHAALSGLYCLAFSRAVAPGCPAAPAALLAFILSLYLPFCGMACGLLLTMLIWWMPRPTGSLMEEFKEHSSLPVYHGPALLPASAERLIEVSRGVEPLVDMVLSSDLKLKRAGLEAIAKRGNPRLIPHLLSALQDPRPEIYQFAMSLVLKLQERFGAEIAKAQEALSRTPGLEARRQLAQAYEQYLRSGLADVAVRTLYRGRLEEEYREILKLAPREATVHAAWGRLSLEARRWPQAKESFEEARRISPNDLKARLGLAEVLYAMGDYKAMGLELRGMVSDMAFGEEENVEPVRLAQWWLSGEEGAAA